MYYSILTFDDDVAPCFLGKIPLVQTPDGLRVSCRTGDTGRLVGENGTVEFLWGDRTACEVPLPTTVDPTDPFQLAPMASYYGRPYGPRGDLIDHGPDTVYVYKLDPDPDNTVCIDYLDSVAYREEQHDTDEPGVYAVDRWYEWDEQQVGTDHIAETDPDYDEVSHVVGFVDGQDMHDPYTHIGVSAAPDGPNALRDVLDRLDAVPLWGPQAAPVDEVQSFDAGHVFSMTAPAAPSV